MRSRQDVSDLSWPVQLLGDIAHEDRRPPAWSILVHRHLLHWGQPPTAFARDYPRRGERSTVATGWSCRQEAGRRLRTQRWATTEVAQEGSRGPDRDRRSTILASQGADGILHPRGRVDRDGVGPSPGCDQEGSPWRILRLWLAHFPFLSGSWQTRLRARSLVPAGGSTRR